VIVILCGQEFLDVTNPWHCWIKENLAEHFGVVNHNSVKDVLREVDRADELLTLWVAFVNRNKTRLLERDFSLAHHCQNSKVVIVVLVFN
jgi:hypothetical protein